MMRWLLTFTVLLSLGMAQSLTIGINDSPDTLDPAISGTYVMRVISAALFDKLFDINAQGQIVPQLATSYRWSEGGKVLTLELRHGVLFQDGEPFNAQAVQFTLERDMTLPASKRKSALSAIEKIEVTGTYSLKLILKHPYAPLIAQLAGRSGMIVAPGAVKKWGNAFGRHPVGAGPFSFVEWVPNGKIVLKRFTRYWDAKAIHIQTLTFLPITSPSVSLADLEAGDVQITWLAPTDVPTVRNNPNLKVVTSSGWGYEGITINLTANDPLAKSPLVREALELSLNRQAINQVVFDGQFVPNNQPYPPGNPWYFPSIPMPQPDPSKALALLKEAGYPQGVQFTLLVPNDPIDVQLAQVIQSMAAQGGFQVKLNVVDFVTALNLEQEKNYQAFLIGWSGRLDPSGNIDIFQSCHGSLNDTGYCDPKVDALLKEANLSQNPHQRYLDYAKAAQLFLAARDIIYLYSTSNIWGLSRKVHGFIAYPDGIIRLQGLRLQ
jgi:peptide/nickel transport system substrate-binding protein